VLTQPPGAAYRHAAWVESSLGPPRSLLVSGYFQSPRGCINQGSQVTPGSGCSRGAVTLPFWRSQSPFSSQGWCSSPGLADATVAELTSPLGQET
jgi:hypothetical protein